MNLEHPCEHEQRNAGGERQTEHRRIGPPQDAAGPDHAAQEKQPSGCQADRHKICHFEGASALYRWKANRRNYKLLIRHIEHPRRYTWRDWFFLLTLGTAIALIFFVPLLVLAWMLDWLFHHL